MASEVITRAGTKFLCEHNIVFCKRRTHKAKALSAFERERAEAERRGDETRLQRRLMRATKTLTPGPNKRTGFISSFCLAVCHGRMREIRVRNERAKCEALHLIDRLSAGHIRCKRSHVDGERSDYSRRGHILFLYKEKECKKKISHKR